MPIIWRVTVASLPTVELFIYRLSSQFEQRISYPLWLRVTPSGLGSWFPAANRDKILSSGLSRLGPKQSKICWGGTTRLLFNNSCEPDLTLFHAFRVATSASLNSQPWAGGQDICLLKYDSGGCKTLFSSCWDSFRRRLVFRPFGEHFCYRPTTQFSVVTMSVWLEVISRQRHRQRRASSSSRACFVFVPSIQFGL